MMKSTVFVALCSLACLPPIRASETDADQQARTILQATGCRGGLVVCLGCGDGRLTAALRANESYLVHGLDADAAKIEAARAYLRSRGLYGPVSVERWSGKTLPYSDNLVNLLVAERLGDVPPAEVLRVLAPGGAAWLKRDGRWQKTVKPRPAAIDDWTHDLHDATNNAVSRDRVVAPPRHFQWQAGPLWTRHHDFMSSFSAMVSAAGRLFYIVDMGSRQSIMLPPHWVLVARDAFSGVRLWERPISKWQSTQWPLKSGPAQLPRRLVAQGDRVYVTLGVGEPVVCLDAASGQARQTYQPTRGAEEILVSDGVLFALVDPQASQEPTQGAYGSLVMGPHWKAAPRDVVAVDARTGEQLWRRTTPVLPLSLTVDQRRVYVHDGNKILCFDRASGRQRWASQPIPRMEPLPSWFGATLVACGDKILFSGGNPNTKRPQETGGNNTMFALSAETGKVLWKAPHPPNAYRSPEDIFVIHNRVYVISVAWQNGEPLFGYDLDTGALVTQFRYNPEIHSYIFPHHRCYRAKATERYILMSQTGIEFVDPVARKWQINHWVRGACLYGIMPANGLIYAPPHPCACFIEAKLNGLCALAPGGSGARGSGFRVRGSGPSDGNARLTRGPAYANLNRRGPNETVGRIGNPSYKRLVVLGPLSPRTPKPSIPNPEPRTPNPEPRTPNPESRTPNPSDWPMYRHDAQRSGCATTEVPRLDSLWRARVGGRLSSPVVSQGKVLVASIDAHSVHALDARSGKRLWSFTAGGRVDSPPTIWHNRACFGSADGYVYCLALDDGALVWRYLAAPRDLRMTAFDQLESVWPVHGSVLVGRNPQDGRGVVYCLAGRSMFLDGGLRLARLEADNGRQLSARTLDEHSVGEGKDMQELVYPGLELRWGKREVRLKLSLPAALPDLLETDGHSLFMRTMQLTLDGRPVPPDLSGEYRDQKGQGVHLFSPTGLLDSSGFHRSYWVLGKRFPAGGESYYVAGRWAPAGNLLVFNDREVYGFGRKPAFYRWTGPMERQLFAMDRDFRIVGKDTYASYAVTPASHPACRWTEDTPVFVRAMVLAGKKLLIAGPPDPSPRESALGPPAARNPQDLAQRDASLRGDRGGLLWAVSTDDGRRLAAIALAHPPVFDGMAAADGKLFMATEDGTVACWGEGKK